MKTITLTQGYVALVDDADFEVVNAFKWYAQKSKRRVYAGRKICKPDGKRTNQFLHQFLLPGFPTIDHRDGNGLNNQRENIRPATQLQNLQGFRRKRLGASSKYRGVIWFRQTSKWQAQISVVGKQIHLGLFEVEQDAARAYDRAATKFFGKFASLNLPSNKKPE